MKDGIKHIFKIKFIQDVGTLQISTIIISVIIMITSLVIARALKPTDFGIYSLAFSLYGLVGTFGNLGIKQTILIKLPSAHINQDKEKILYILAYYFKTILIVSISIMIAGYIFVPYLSRLLYGSQDIGRLCRILFLIPPLVILYKLVRETLEGTRNMRYLAILESTSTLINSFILIILVSLGLGLTVLVSGWLFYAIISSILAIFIYKKSALVKDTLPSISEIIKKSYFVDTRQFLRFNLLMGLSENIIVLNEYLPIILLGIFVLPNEVGYFKLGYSIMGLSILLEPISRNLLIKLRQLKASKDIKGLSNTFYKVSLYTGIISIILVTIIIILYHLLIYFLLKDYQPSLKIIYPLAIYFCLTGFGIGLSPILRALERLDIEIKINAIGILIFVVSSILLIKNLGILGLTLALVISVLFTKFAMYLLLKNLLKLETL